MREPSWYQIRIHAVLDEKWSSYFAPFTISWEENDTLLSGIAQDQAELYGVLLKIRDLGLSLVSVNPIPGLG